MAEIKIFKTSKLYSRFDYIYPSVHVTEDGKMVTFYPFMVGAVNDASHFIDAVFTKANGDTK